MSTDPESKVGGEVIPEDISGLPAELGFELTPEVAAARQAAVEAMTARDWDAIKSTMGIYHDACQVAIDSLELDGEKLAHAHIGLGIDKALMWHEAGKLDSYVAELNNAALYAHNIYLDKVADRLWDAAEAGKEAHQASLDSPYKGPPTSEILAKASAKYPQLAEEFDLLYAHEPGEALDEVVSLIASHPDIDDGVEFLEQMGWTA